MGGSFKCLMYNLCWPTWSLEGSTSRGPLTPKPGPFTKAQPVPESNFVSNSAQSPPAGPLQFRPVVNTVAPEGRLLFKICDLVGSSLGLMNMTLWATIYTFG